MIRPIIRTLIVLCCALLCAPILLDTTHAGFSDPANKPAAGRRAKGVPIGKPGSDISTELRDGIKNFFSSKGLSDAQADEKIEFIRNNIRKAIELVEKENPQLGKELREAMDSGRLCLDMNSSIFVAAEIDRDENGKPVININISRFHSPFLSCENLAAHRGDIFKMMQTLLHEGIHHGQEELTPQGGAESKKHYRARRGKLYACHEIEAEDAENALANELLAALNHYIDNGTVPAGLDGAVEEIMDDLSGGGSLTPQQRINRAKALRAAVETNKEGNDARKACEEAKKQAYDEFLTAYDQPGSSEFTLWNELQDKLKQLDWEKKRIEDNRRQKDIIYYLAPPSNSLIQSDGDSTVMLYTSLMEIRNFIVIGDSTRCVITGPLNEFGDGALMGYTDVDDDGFYESETEVELIQMDVLNDAGDIIVDPMTGDLILFNAITNELWRMEDTTADGWPDWIDSAGAIDFFRDDIMHIQIADDGQSVYGMIESAAADDLIMDPALEIPVSDRVGGEWLIGTPYVFGDQARFMPVFADPPDDASLDLYLDGIADAAVSVHRVDTNGVSLEMLASTVLDASGMGVATLELALTAGDEVQVRDDTNAMHGVPQMVEGVTGVGDTPSRCRGCVSELAAHPNPFNPRVTISFRLEGETHVEARFFDVRGRQVRRVDLGRLPAGPQSFRWDGLDDRGASLASGSYFVRVSGEAGQQVLKLMLVR